MPNNSDTAANGASRLHCRLLKVHSYATSATGSITASSLHLYASQKQTRPHTQRPRTYRLTLSRQNSPQSASNTYIGFHTASNRAIWRAKNTAPEPAANGGAPSLRANSHTSHTFSRWTACRIATNFG